MVRDFADALGLGQFAISGVSGAGKYACACAWRLPGRTTHFVPGTGHLLDDSDHLQDVLHSVLSGSRR